MMWLSTMKPTSKFDPRYVRVMYDQMTSAPLYPNLGMCGSVGLVDYRMTSPYYRGQPPCEYCGGYPPRCCHSWDF